MTQLDTAPRRGNHALAFIMILLVLDTIGFGITVPVMPLLVTHLTGADLSSAALYGGWLMFIYALMQFLFSPMIGNLSDAFGRRSVLLISVGTLAIDYLIMATAPNITWLFVGRTLSGIAGATTATASAYIADITPPENRARGFGMIGAAWALGFTVGPAIGGFLGSIGPRAPFLASAGLAFINLLYGVFVLHESLSKDKRRPFVLWRANPLGALLDLRGFNSVFAVFAIYILYLVAHEVYSATWTYFVMQKFNWSQIEIGAALAVVGLSSAAVSGGLTGRAVKRLGEVGVVYLGLVSSIIAFLGFAFASKGWIMYPFIVIGALMGLITPALRSIASRAMPADRQGELQGAFSSLNGFVSIFAPVLLTEAFHFFTGRKAPIYFPGAPFALGALLLVGAAVIVRSVVSHLKLAAAE
ncbi:MAG TPA: TCR/Tet family MFS transporter [Alphaproteobacteria bacterium]|nr:TCR/Tet family MFS transporter [Alphaproteobacteria bacterium]